MYFPLLVYFDVRLDMLTSSWVSRATVVRFVRAVHNAVVTHLAALTLFTRTLKDLMLPFEPARWQQTKARTMYMGHQHMQM